MASRYDDIKVPDGVNPTDPFVVILDPATGTATFLVEVIDVIHDTLMGKWSRLGLSDAAKRDAWNEYVPKHLLPRLYGYELMMAPYAIAHMKIGLKLSESGYRFQSDARARLYMTNALEPPSDMAAASAINLFEALGHEAQAVNRVKRNVRFTVVIGNPPYSVMSANLSEDVRRIVDQYRYVDGERIRERSMLRLEMHLQDDYVKFLALMQRLTASARFAVLGAITNGGYLDNLTLRGVRWSLHDQFPVLRILNLHGSRQRKDSTIGDTDENVFDIEQGVAVTVAATPPGSREFDIRYGQLVGQRRDKSSILLHQTAAKSCNIPIAPSSPNYFLVPRDDSTWPEYSMFSSLTDIMPVNISGIVTAHDRLVVDFEERRLLDNARLLRDVDVDDDRVRSLLHVKDNAGWKLSKARAELRKSKHDQPFVQPYAYRPFDVRRIFYHPDLVWCDRRKVMANVLGGSNLALATCRQLARLPWDHVFVTRYLQDDCLVSNRTRERSYHFPLLLKDDPERNQRELALQRHEDTANFSAEFCRSISQKLGGEDPGPAAIFQYLYAVLHSEDYRRRYAEFLKIDFPRIPLPEGPGLFYDLARLGSELVDLHLLESPAIERPMTKVIRGSNGNDMTVEKVTFAKQTVWIDKAQTIGFSGVIDAVWDFHVGSYPRV